ncbi:MAG: 1-acyl-sn-glycerol-3-phosphate acyltransferase [Pseudomonadota bacterium]
MGRLSPQSWNEIAQDELPPLTSADWFRVIARGVPLAAVTFGCLALLLMLRVLERPIHGIARPWTPKITQFVCKSAFLILGMTHVIHGEPMQGPGAVVGNHASWLDIFAYNARQPIYFVSKAEVAHWPAIGWLARATGTVFVRRNRAEAHKQRDLLLRHLSDGHLLLFFPEGTSTDGLRVLNFKSTLFEPFFMSSAVSQQFVQPVTIIYRSPVGASLRFYGWWGDMAFGPHLLKTLAAPRQGCVDVYYHQPMRISDFSDRKALAVQCEAVVRDCLERQLDREGPEGARGSVGAPEFSPDSKEVYNRR